MQEKREAGQWFQLLKGDRLLGTGPGWSYGLHSHF